MTTTETLAHARSDIHAAVAAHDDPDRRRQHAHSAASYAAEVLLASDAERSQREQASLYLDEAHGMLTATELFAAPVVQGRPALLTGQHETTARDPLSPGVGGGAPSATGRTAHLRWAPWRHSPHHRQQGIEA